MTWQIFKVTLTQRETHVSLPPEARILCTQMQRGEPQIWFMFDMAKPGNIARVFRIVGTGNPFDEDLHEQYIGTVQQGQFVWHIFEGPVVHQLDRHPVTVENGGQHPAGSP